MGALHVCVVESKTSPIDVPQASPETSQAGELPERVMITHKVLKTDTLQGICLRYNVKKSVIKKHNDFLKDRVHLRKVLTFPADPQSASVPVVEPTLTPGQLLRKRIRAAYYRVRVPVRQHHSKSTTPKFAPPPKLTWACLALELPNSDIRSYLSLHDEDVDAAFAALKSDMEWEVAQKMAKLAHKMSKRKSPYLVHMFK